MTSGEGLDRVDRLRKCAFLFLLKRDIHFLLPLNIKSSGSWTLRNQPGLILSPPPHSLITHRPQPTILRPSDLHSHHQCPYFSSLQTAYHGTPTPVIVLTNSCSTSPHIYSYPIGSVLWRTLIHILKTSYIFFNYHIYIRLIYVFAFKEYKEP